MRRLKDTYKTIGFIGMIILFCLALEQALFAQDLSQEAARGEAAQENIAEENREKVEISPVVIEKKMPAYAFNLKQLIEEAERNIKKVEVEIRDAEILKRNKERESKAHDHFERGNLLYSQGKFKEAKEEWRKAIDITKELEMKDYIRTAERRANDERLARRKEEKLAHKKLLSEEKERKRQESKRQEELKREAELKKREEAKKRETELKAKKKEARLARLETEHKRKALELARKEAQAKQKKELKLLERKRLEEERARRKEEKLASQRQQRIKATKK